MISCRPTGVANQSEIKSHISHCVTAKSHVIHTGAHEHHPIFSARVCYVLAPSHQTRFHAMRVLSRTRTFKVKNWYKILRLMHE